MEVFINNAGLVLLYPYLPQYFDRTGVMQSGAFSSEQEQQQAVLLLECGMDYNSRLIESIEVKQEDKDITGQMLDAVIANWQMIKNSSHEGFREAWLRREGKLTQQETSWDLTVEQKAYDILLDHLPYTLNQVKLPWMKMPINVQWR